jgi:hypothetical protein
MSAHSGVDKDTPHATPGLRSAPPFWSSEPTDSGRVELLLEDMERCGVDGAVLVQTSFSTWNNEYVAAAALRFPSRCRSMGMVDPLDPEAVKHAIYWMDHRGMSGFRFHPSYCPSSGTVWQRLTPWSNLTLVTVAAVTACLFQITPESLLHAQGWIAVSTPVAALCTAKFSSFHTTRHCLTQFKCEAGLCSCTRHSRRSCK